MDVKPEPYAQLTTAKTTRLPRGNEAARPAEIKPGHFCELYLAGGCTTWGKVTRTATQGVEGEVIAKPEIRITFSGRHILRAFLPVSGRAKTKRADK